MLQLTLDGALVFCMDQVRDAHRLCRRIGLEGNVHLNQKTAVSWND